MSLKIATQQRSSNRISRSTAKTVSSSTRVRPPGYHLQRTIGNSATSRLLKTNHIQAKLTVSNPGDAAEREADRVAGEVMRMPEPQPGLTVQRSPLKIQRSCDKCEEELKRKPILDKDDEELHAKFADASGGSGVTGGLQSYLNTSRGAGQQLPPSSRAYFEPRLGRDLSDVRIHTDGQASQAASSISAKAFTAGNNIVFGAGQHAPQTHQGRTLLAHELTHVIQQSDDQHLQRQWDPIGDIKEGLKKKAEEFAKQKLGALAAEPAGPASGFKGEAKCGPNFCQPFVSKSAALFNLKWAGPLILAGIASKVNTRVLPLWVSYLTGGSATKDLTADFGADFTASKTTADTTKFLVGELRKEIQANQTGLPTAPGTVVRPFTSRLAGALAAIDDPKGGDQMNFNYPSDTAGNVAGGIGKDETSFPIGAKPSPFNDSREAEIAATVTRNADGSLTVVPAIKFLVKDTIDLCPGDCGVGQELVATIPLSRFEATGITGDVPLKVEFDAPASELKPFHIPASPPPPVKTPVPGKVTASKLYIRSAPNTSAPPLGSYPRGAKISVLCQTKGMVIDGNDAWFQTDKGFVSARYVTLSGPAAPAAC